MFESLINEINAGRLIANAAAKQLHGALTPQEKVDILSGTPSFASFAFRMVTKGYDSIHPAAEVPRLGIPGYLFSDGPRGCLVGPGTTFPVSSLRAATFDPALEEEVVSNRNSTPETAKVCRAGRLAGN
jgi:beta-glucosidase